LNSGADFLREPRPPYLIDGVLPAGALVALSGREGEGKSFVALDFSLSIAAGVPWAGHAVRQAPVVFASTDPDQVVGSRFHSWLCAHGLGQAPADWYRYSLEAVGQVLRQPLTFPRLEAALSTLPRPPALVVIDTWELTPLVQEHQGREAWTRLSDGFARLHARYGCTVLMTQSEPMHARDRHRERVVWWAADTRLSTRQHGRQIELVCEHQDADTPFAPITLELTAAAKSAYLRPT
jgi:RecA-family ATPase